MILIVTIPLFIAYFKSNDIIMLLKKRKKRYMKDNNLSERKEVKVVSSRDRKRS
ncbi:MAG: hypothetical protein L6V91_09030 [Bacilli bacterium]|nr:MAG: hypothetical protein L6V91_09030 [Bacilli bacterium]